MYLQIQYLKGFHRVYTFKNKLQDSQKKKQISKQLFTKKKKEKKM